MVSLSLNWTDSVAIYATRTEIHGGFLNYGSMFMYASKMCTIIVSVFKNVACLRLNTPQIARSTSVWQKKKKN